jgi:hypothetical protein
VTTWHSNRLPVLPGAGVEEGTVGVGSRKMNVEVGVSVIVGVSVGRGVCVIVLVGGEYIAVCVAAASAVCTMAV